MRRDDIKPMLKTFGVLVLVLAVLGGLSQAMKSLTWSQTPQPCADPAACEAANKIAYANAAKNEAELKAREKDWATHVTALRVLKASMHDPASFEVVQVLHMPDKTLCITHRARNGFGALRIGRYVLAPKSGASDADARFANLWNKHCGGKTCDDITYIKRAM